jgi:hypothetical protein
LIKGLQAHDAGFFPIKKTALSLSVCNLRTCSPQAQSEESFFCPDWQEYDFFAVLIAVLISTV